MPTPSIRLPFTAFYLTLIVAACLATGCTPSGPKALLQGEQLIRKGKHTAAIAKLRIATELMRNEPRAWNYLGLAYHGAGQLGEAVMAYQRAQQLDHNLAAARYNLGELYLEQGNPVSAVEELSVFTALEPKSVTGWVRLGDAHLQNRRLDRAQISYETALKLKRENPAALNGLGLILLQRKNPTLAYRYFVEAAKYDANYTPAILNMAVVAHTQLNGLSTALARYKDYVAKAPTATNALAVRAVIRQLEADLNPAPLTNRAIAVAGNSTHPMGSVATNLTTRPLPPTGKPTNLVSHATTNLIGQTPTHAIVAAAARTNAPTATNVAIVARPDPHNTKPGGATNHPPVQVASAEAATKTATESKPTSIAANKPIAAPEAAPTTPTAKVNEEPPLEVVSVAENPILPAGEIARPGDLRPVPDAQEVPLVSPVGARTNPARGEPGAAPAAEKRGFLKRINPVNLFRREKPATPDSPALPPQETKALSVEQPAVTARPAPESQPAKRAAYDSQRNEVTPIPTSTSGTRYQYGKIKKPVAGDRPAAERLFERGIGAQNRRDPTGAATFFASAAAADPTYFAAQYNLGLASYAAGQWFSALSAFETALVLEPNSTESRYNFALTLQKANFPADAARELENLLTRQPDSASSHLLLGNLYAQELADTGKAREHYLKVLVLDPRHPQAAAIRGWLVAHP